MINSDSSETVAIEQLSIGVTEDVERSGQTRSLMQLFNSFDDRRPTRAGQAIGIAAMVTAVAAIPVVAAGGGVGSPGDDWVFARAAAGLAFGLLLTVLVSEQPRNRAIWAVGLGGLLFGFNNIGHALARSDAGFSSWFEWLLIPAVGLSVGFGLLLFPDGRLPSLRWRPLALATALSIGVASIAVGIEAPGAVVVGVVALAVSFAVPLASLVARYRNADGDLRHQLRWMLLPVIAVAPLLGFAGSAGGREVSVVIGVIILAGVYGTAVVQYRLYAIDLLLSKSMTYLGIVALITVVYAAVVLAGPRLLLGAGSSDLALPLLATAVIAILFEPARRRLGRQVDRLVYGRQASPLQVLSQLTARLSASPTDGGDELAQVVAAGTGAEQVTVWVQAGAELLPHGRWQTDSHSESEPPSDGDLTDTQLSITRTVRHGGEPLGAITVTKPATDPINQADIDLLDDVAGNAGLVLRHLSLNAQLQERASDVRASRQRLIKAQDAERHRLERDLHDGAQQHVVLLNVKLGIARSMAERHGNDGLVTAIDGLSTTTREAVDSMRAIAHGIYPPLLEVAGLATALAGMANNAAIEISLDLTIGDEDRYPRAVEDTIYFCAVEAMNRAAGAGATTIAFWLGQNDDRLHLVARHDAVVHPPALTAIVDRVDAAEGTLEIEDAIGRVSLTVPVSGPGCPESW